MLPPRYALRIGPAGAGARGGIETASSEGIAIMDGSGYRLGPVHEQGH